MFGAHCFLQEEIAMTNALKIFSKWARKYLLFPGEAKHIVREVANADQQAVRATWTGKARAIEAVLSVTSSRSRKTDIPIAENEIDPWDVDTDSLREHTSQLVECPKCYGEKRLDCTVCNGTSYVRCPSCNGSGTAMSKNGNRVVHCQACRGRGEKKCQCRTGTVKCEQCAGKGKVDRWLEIRESPFIRSKILPLGEDALKTPWTVSGSTKIDTRYASDSPVEEHIASRPDTLPENFQQWLKDNALSSDISPCNERLHSIKVELFERQISTVYFGILGTDSSIEIAGPRQNVFETSSSSSPLKLRLGALGLVALIPLIVGFFVRISYLSQHPYFECLVNSSCIMWTSFIWAIVSIPLTIFLMHRKLRQRIGPIIAMSAVCILCVSGMAVAANTGAPSLDDAKVSFDAGDFEGALEMSQVLIDLNIQSDDAARMKEQILLNRQLEASGFEEAYKLFDEHDYQIAEFKKRAVAQVVELSTERLLSLQSQNKHADANAMISSLPSYMLENRGLKTRVLVSKIHDAEACVNSMNHSCVADTFSAAKNNGASPNVLTGLTERSMLLGNEKLEVNWKLILQEKAPQARHSLILETKNLYQFMKVAGVSDEQFAVAEQEMNDELTRTEKKLEQIRIAEEKEAARQKRIEEKRIAREKKQQELEEKRRIRAEKRAERERVAAMKRAAWSDGRARCCDGTLSPSCSCGGGRGCCSHHKGVCGCERY